MFFGVFHNRMCSRHNRDPNTLQRHLEGIGSNLQNRHLGGIGSIKLGGPSSCLCSSPHTHKTSLSSGDINAATKGTEQDFQHTEHQTLFTQRRGPEGRLTY
eukprot:1829141-Amphidinium_carterae.1